MVPRDLFEAYESALHSNIELMRTAFADLLAECAMMEPMEAKRYARKAYLALVKRYGPFASVAAMEFYEQVRESAALKTTYKATAFVPDIDALLEYDANLASEAADISKMIDRLFGSGTERVMQHADETITQNAAADPAKPKWALVPHIGACGWCRFIASRGFDYVSSDKVARHANCKCSPVADFDTKHPHLDGYDPSALHDEYRRAREAVEDDARATWDTMTQEEREKYKTKGRGAYDHYLRNRIVEAMNSA